MKDTILVTGALGQLGSELAEALAKTYGNDHVILTDIREPDSSIDMPFEKLNVLDANRVGSLCSKYRVTQVYHLAALLSATGEQRPKLAWELNVNGLLNVLDACLELDISKVYWPSTIGVFGPDTPKQNTPQRTIMNPITVYGISKLAGEKWCEYYHMRYGLDVRSLRYPGLIGYKGEPGGGTTDYAVEIFHKAARGEMFTCYLEDDTRLPMMYMPDAIRATLELMDSPYEAIKVRTSYNIAAISFTPAEIADNIRKHLPGLEVSTRPDDRQKIADSWPQSIDDHAARKQWGWKHAYDLDKMVADMLSHLIPEKVYSP